MMGVMRMGIHAYARVHMGMGGIWLHGLKGLGWFRQLFICMVQHANTTRAHTSNIHGLGMIIW